MDIIRPQITHVVPLFRALHAYHVQRRPDIYHCDGTDAEYAAVLQDICDTGGRLYAHDAGWGLVSYVAARPEDRPRTGLRHDRTAMVIEHLYIAPQVRGLGLGRALITAVETWATARGLSRWTVAQDAGNREASAFYTQIGADPQAVFRSKTIGL
ncbi:GNAT family N-acetyltransferase [Marivita sp. S0852]|uniref:GNAT family N-acetyltransferase n=1 Tax=Marivita sp. S0852 TaxID=3373893 RepID=UPI003981A506